ncbi:general transcription factor 3C polypeptide 2 [Stigmatopora nigra]
MVNETTVSDDLDDPEPGQETPSKPSLEITFSSRGRQRKKNPKYADYDTMEDPIDIESSFKKPKEKPNVPTSRQTSPRKRGRPKRVPLPTVEVSEAPHVANGDAAMQTNVTSPSLPEGSLENGTPKPKRKYVKRKTFTMEPIIPLSLENDDPKPVPRPQRKYVKSKTLTMEPVIPLSLENGDPEPAPKPKRKYVKRKTFTMEPIIPPEETVKEEEEALEPGMRPRRSAAKLALKFLHAMAEEETPKATGGDVTDKSTPNMTEGEKGQVRRGRKRKCSDGDAAEDKDFVPVADEMEEEEEVDEEEDEDEEGEDYEDASDLDSEIKHNNSCRRTNFRPALEMVSNHKNFRLKHLSDWVFPDWLPSSHTWHQVPSCELENYLPQEHLSADFKVSRESSGDQMPIQRLGRFEASPAHPQGWDMHLYTGGPVWAMEWCPIPDNAVGSQYLAVGCYRNMDDQHFYHQTYSGQALVQLWDVGTLEYNTRPSFKPALVYGLVVDSRFIRNLKWCPSGGWEEPTMQKEAPLLPRLGLLAVGCSSGVVTIYSLPHPDALRASHDHSDSGDDSLPFIIYKPDPVVTLKLGSLKAPNSDQSGQVLCMDWLPIQPHDVIAVGFYDGMVGLWDLGTKSALLRFQESPDSITLFPYKSFLAHDQAVRALTFCAASKYLMATAGEDRVVKTWDLRRMYGPVTTQRRPLINEICWPACSPGLFWAQDVTFAAKNTNGVHFVDHQMNTYFAIPRKSSLWSISYSEWLHCVVTSDMLGEVIISTLPNFVHFTPSVKRPVEKRYPVYVTSLKQQETEEDQKVCQEEEEGEKKGDDGAENGHGLLDASKRSGEEYTNIKRKYYLHYSDNSMVNIFSTASHLWKQMKNNEYDHKLNLDELPLASLHKIRLNPNLKCHTWVATGGQSGLVRLICIRGLINKDMGDIINGASQ